MTANISHQALQTAYDGYASNLKNPNLEGVRAISVGRAVGLALELGQIHTANAIWDAEVAPVAGMPTLAEFREGYQTHKDAFDAFETGEGKAFTAPCTELSNAVGCYVRALEDVATIKEPAGEDSGVYWSGDWGAKALTAAGFPEQAAALKEAIVSGKPLEKVKAKGASVAS